MIDIDEGDVVCYYAMSKYRRIQMNVKIDPDWITTKEAMQLTGYSQEYIRVLLRDNKVESSKIGSNWFVSRKSLMEYFKRQEDRR